MNLSDKTVYKIEVLGNRHDRNLFSCSSNVLDQYFKQQVSQDVKRHIAAAFVLTEEKQREVIGFYTLSSIAIDPSDFPERIVKRLPEYSLLPGILLGRLAVDEQWCGKGLGGMLLVDALRRSTVSSREIASMAVIVDAKDEKAAAFYERFGFIRFFHNNSKLFLPMSTIELLF
jgi:predicted GNAT family N-acyltransferase